MNLLTKIGISATALAATALTGGVALAHEKGVDVSTLLASPVVTIGGQGNALVRGAKVTDVSGSTITAKTTWPDTSFTWTVKTDSDTEFYATGKNTEDLADIDVGDVISFAGNLTGAFSLEASAVRDWTDATDQSGHDADEDNHDNGKHKGWDRPFLNFWSSLKANFH